MEDKSKIHWNNFSITDKLFGGLWLIIPVGLFLLFLYVMMEDGSSTANQIPQGYTEICDNDPILGETCTFVRE